MDKKVKNKWLKALRSGSYAPASAFLCVDYNCVGKGDRDDVRYSAVGVLVEEVYGEDIWPYYFTQNPKVEGRFEARNAWRKNTLTSEHFQSTTGLSLDDLYRVEQLSYEYYTADYGPSIKFIEENL